MTDCYEILKRLATFADTIRNRHGFSDTTGMKISKKIRNILTSANVAILAIGLQLVTPSCSTTPEGHDITGRWITKNILVKIGDEWIGAHEEIYSEFGIDWVFSDEYVTIDTYSLKYRIEENILLLDNGSSFKIVNHTATDLQLGTPVNGPTIYILLTRP